MKFQRPPKARNVVQVVPLIDILLVLLIFFVVSTHFKQPRDVMRIDLPVAKDSATEKLTDTRSVIAIGADGTAMLDALAVPDGLLDAYLKQFIEQNPGRRMELEIDKRAAFGRVWDVRDALTKAGIAIKDVPVRFRPTESATPPP